MRPTPTDERRERTDDVSVRDDTQPGACRRLVRGPAIHAVDCSRVLATGSDHRRPAPSIAGGQQRQGQRLMSASSSADQAIAHARAAEASVQGLCQVTLSRPALTPAEAAVVLSHLAAGVAGLPQASAQLAEILDQAKSDQVLETDTMSDTSDPTLAVDTARLHLEEAREAAVVLYRLLDAAHQQAAHLISHTAITRG